jgi:hypothetical protein
MTHKCTQEDQFNNINDKLENIQTTMQTIHNQINLNGNILTRLDKLEQDQQSKSKLNWIVLTAILSQFIPLIMKYIFKV